MHGIREDFSSIVTPDQSHRPLGGIIIMRNAWQLLAGFALIAADQVNADVYTPIHEAGRCAIRGTCGKKSFFGAELPCPDNGLAADPADDVRKQLVDLCGPKWTTGPVCCEAAQVRRYPFSYLSYSNAAHRSMRSNPTLRKRTTSYPPARLARIISTIYSAPSPVLPINLCS